MNDAPDTGLLSEYPVWRQAAKDACAEFAYGDIIPLNWIREHLEIEEPVGLMSAETHRKLSFDLLQKVDGFRTCMIEEHKRMIVNVRGVGYKVVEPPSQTDAAMNRFRREFYKAWGQAMTNLVHINESMLSLDEARANAEAKAKLAWFKSKGVKHIEHQPQQGDADATDESK